MQTIAQNTPARTTETNPIAHELTAFELALVSGGGSAGVGHRTAEVPDTTSGPKPVALAKV